MNNALNYIDFSMAIENECLCLGEEVLLSIEIKNKSEYKLENGLFRCVIDESIFKPQDEYFYGCISDFDNIGDIEPGYKISIKIPLKVVKIPLSKYSEIFSYLNFHIVKDDELVDINYTSDLIKINILNIEILEKENFTIKSLKKNYNIEENIDLSIILKNTTSDTLNNIKISNYIPKDTNLIVNSIDSNNIESIFVSDDNIIINELKSNETIKIFYKVNIDGKNELGLIKSIAKLNYKSSNKDISIESNAIEININSGNVFTGETFLYSLDKNRVNPDEVVTHTIILKNQLDIELLNMKLKNNFFDKVKFIKNSLIINGIYRVEESIREDIILGDLEPKEEFEVSFKTEINDLYEELELFFSLEYETCKRGILKQDSNKNKIEVLYISFKDNGIIKTQSKENYELNDIIDFSIKLFNSGNTSARNVFLYDNIPKSLEIIPGTIYLNDENLNTVQKIVIEEIPPNEEILINYKARAINICTNEKSNCSIEYFTESSTCLKKVSSNDNFISVIGAKLGNYNFKKELSSYSSKVGEIITALITIENTGNIVCESLNLYETKNPAIEIIEDSLQINGKNVHGNITTGINIERINPSEIITVKYQLRIISIPRPNPIQDKSILEYTFFHNAKLQNNTVYSTKSKLYINNPDLSILDKSSIQMDNLIQKYVHRGESLLYNIQLYNIGNVAFENVVMSFNFPKELLIDIKSIKINNHEYTTNSSAYIKLPNINVSQRIYIQFYARCINKDIDTLETNIYIDFVYKDLRNKNSINVSKKYSQNINIVYPDLEISKIILDKDIEKNKELVENINIRNAGNILLKNIKLNLNENEYLKKCKSTLFINDSYEPKSEIIDIDKLDINESTNIAIRYSIDELPSNDRYINESEIYANYSYTSEDDLLYIKRISNKIKINIKDYKMSIQGKCVEKNIILNEKSTYIITVSNNGNTKSKSSKLKLDLEEGISVINNSITVNGKIIDNSSCIDLGSINYNDNVIVKFDFIVNKMPYGNCLRINGKVECEYIENQENISKIFSYESDNIFIKNITLDIAKSVSNHYLQNGEVITIQTILNNTGSVGLSNIELLDNSNKNLTYIQGSTYINGENSENLDPVSGILIPNINKGENVLVSYEYEYKPKTYYNKMVHYSDLSYSYKVDNDEYKRISTQSEEVHLEGALSTFKQFNIENEYDLKESEPDIYEVVNVFTDCDIDDFYEIKHSRNKHHNRNENNTKKIVVKGIIIERVEYLSKKEIPSLYMLERRHPFTVFLNIPQDDEYIDLNFRSKCENVFYKTIGSRSIFISNLVSIEGLI